MISPQPRTPPFEGMAWIPGGAFRMGSDRHYPEEAPAHDVRVAGFWMDVVTVTNAQFRAFVEATGHVTLAERPADRNDYPDADPALLAPASVVFRKTSGPVDLRDHRHWWTYVVGADWRHPEGPGSTIASRDDHPVVHVAYADAAAYATWARKSLPTEAEWERAARGGLENAEYVWGDDYMPGGTPMANTWQGKFPWQNLLHDGFESTAPARTFPANGYGLYQMAGNVWEWTSDFYQAHSSLRRACCTLEDPRGGAADASHDPEASTRIARRVTKGGSFLCAPSYCQRYRPAARMAQPVDTSTCHLGFRCVVRM